jgi:hypothetical protein
MCAYVLMVRYVRICYDMCAYVRYLRIRCKHASEHTVEYVRYVCIQRKHVSEPTSIHPRVPESTPASLNSPWWPYIHPEGPEPTPVSLNLLPLALNPPLCPLSTPCGPESTPCGPESTLVQAVLSRSRIRKPKEAIPELSLC